MSIEDQVRQALLRQAERFWPHDDRFDDILRRARLGEPAPKSRPGVRRLVLIAATFLVFIVAVVPLWIAYHGGTVVAPPSSLPASVGAESAPRCSGSQLSVHAVPTDGAAGNVLTPIVLTNKSSDACSLAGYPSLRFFGRDGRDLGLHVSDRPNDSGQIPPSPISRVPFVLAPGAKAWFRLHANDVIPPCARATAIAITPPGGTGVMTLHANPTQKFFICTGTLSVTAATPTDVPR